MSIDPRQFHTPAVTDTCSVWNILSSKKLFDAAIQANAHFLITKTIHYECVHKKRKNITPEQQTLIIRYKSALDAGHFPQHSFEIEDLMEVSKNAPIALSSGELSCIAIAYKIRSISLMTDEKKARNHASTLGIKVETTPKLYAWLHYTKKLQDSDHSSIIQEHEKYERRPLTSFFNEAYDAAMRASLMDRTQSHE